MAAEMIISRVRDVRSARKKGMRRIIVGKNTSKNALEYLSTKTLRIKPLPIKTLHMMRAFQKAKEKRESILALQLLSDH